MGKKRKTVSRGAQQRTRTNPKTGQVETVSGTKAGKKRNRLPFGHELRTHDIHPPKKTERKKKSPFGVNGEEE